MNPISIYTIHNILNCRWKMISIISIMVVEGISILSGVSLYKVSALSPVPLYGLLFFLLIINAGIVYSDFSIGKLELIFAKPISKIGYLLGKFAGVFVIIIIWDILNLIYLELLMVLFQKSGVSLLYLGENFIFHMFNIIPITIAIIFFSTFIASGIDSVIFILMTIGAGMLSSNIIIPEWIVKYSISFQFSHNFFRLYHGIEDKVIICFTGFFITILFFGIAGFFLLKKRVEN